MPGSKIAPAPPQGAPPQAAAAAGAADVGGELLKRAEVRDVLAWLRLLVEPQDAAAVVRALARPPIELRQVDLARVIQVARRRKLDLVVGLKAAAESPQVPPEARERIARFVELHRSMAAQLDGIGPDVFLDRLIGGLSGRGRALLTPEQDAQQQQSLRGLHALAIEFVRGAPGASTRDLAGHLAALAPDSHPGEAPVELERSRESVLEATLQALREEVLAGIARIGGRLGELRFDTDLDISHGVVSYLELLKLSALVQRPAGEDEDIDAALADINARLLAAATPLQREILQTSPLDAALISGEGGAQAGASALGAREEHSLAPFMPRKGAGLALSAGDIQTYRSCPLRYKFARVLRIPSEQTVHQRFGIAVHQVLERFHGGEEGTLEQLLELLDSVWRRSGMGDSAGDAELLGKARVALTRYHARLHEQDARPVWFERAFSFRIGPHHLRGRVDRVDRLEEGEDAEYELIDYKTSRPKTDQQVGEDIQLDLYALAAREDWSLASTRQAYYYVLDDLKVPVHSEPHRAAAVEEIVLGVGEGIMEQRFEPTPSRAACSICDYRIVCPAAET